MEEKAVLASGVPTARSAATFNSSLEPTVLSATQCDVGRFGEDLFARINLWTFFLPSLVERREDIVTES